MPNYRSNPFCRLVAADGRELVQLDYLGPRDFGVDYLVRFSGILPEEFAQLSESDPRDIPYFFERKDGGTVAYATIGYTWIADQSVLHVRFEGCYPTSPRPTLWDRLLHRRLPVVPQERAPAEWVPLKRHRIVAGIASGDDELMFDALASCGYYSRHEDLAWTVPLLVDATRRLDTKWRGYACLRLGEIARVYGYTDSQIVLALENALVDPEDSVRRCAAMSLGTIRRFTAGPIQVRSEPQSGC